MKLTGRESAAEAVDSRAAGIRDRSVELSWREHRFGGSLSVISIARPKSADRWALGHFRRLFRVSTAFLHSRAGVWDQVFAVSGRLNAIGVLGDGSVLAVGESVSVLFDGEWSTIGSGLPACRRIWGANPGCVNALSDQGLSCFGGRSWERVDLDAQGIPGGWADGDVDSRGIGWIVGTNGTHSCMAMGSGRSWQKDGCGAGYLYLVHVPDDGHAFAAGGDGLWRHDGVEWIDVDQLHHSDVSRSPLALSSARERPIAVACTLQHLRQQAEGSGCFSELEIYTAAGWQTVRTPAPITIDFYSRGTRFEIDTGARLLMAQGSSIWESARIIAT